MNFRAEYIIPNVRHNASNLLVFPMLGFNVLRLREHNFVVTCFHVIFNNIF